MNFPYSPRENKSGSSCKSLFLGKWNIQSMQGTSGEEALSQIRKGFGVSFPVVLFAMFKDIIEVQQSQNQTKYVPCIPCGLCRRACFGTAWEILTWSLNSTWRRKKGPSYLPPRESVALMPHIIANCFFYGMHNLDGKKYGAWGKEGKSKWSSRNVILK